MQYTSNYNLITVEGTDLVNPMTQMNPNFTSLDSIIKSVSDATITTATEVTVGTVHGLTRSLPDANVIRFIATSNWTTGDTFEVDNTSVTALKTDGTPLKTGDYVIGANVLGILDGTRFTVYATSAPATTAAAVSYDNTTSGMAATDVQDAVDELDAAVDTINSSLVGLIDDDLGADINITSYTTANKYTFPSDGYVKVSSGDTSGQTTFAMIYGSTNDSVNVPLWARSPATNYRGYASLYVRKGMRCATYATEGTGGVTYTPLQ